MAVVTGEDEIDVELLRDKPKLFLRRLRYFLSEDDADHVLLTLSQVCNRCWDAEEGECDCDKPRKTSRKGVKVTTETRQKISEGVTAAWERRMKAKGKI